MTITIPMTECENCLICNVYIGTGNDPAICDNEKCRTLYEYEIAFIKWEKEMIDQGG